MTHHIDLDGIHLISGAGSPDGDELCVMQWVARFAGEPVTDHPACTSPVLTAFAIAWNDAASDEQRQELIPYIPRLVGTAGDSAADERRAWPATDWLVRTFTPTWLRRAGLTERAAELEALPELTSTELARSAQAVIDRAKSEAYAAAGAAAGAAGAAAWAAAGAAAWDAARAAARAAAWDAAGDAAWDAARAAAWAAAWDAAGDAAGAAARAAAWAAAKGKKGYDAQYAAARKAADEVFATALADTVAELRASGLALLDRLIDAGVPVG
jgi:hypothetical protein